MAEPKQATFAEPNFVTKEGTRVLIWASPTGGIIIRTRTEMGSESGGSIPLDVALVLLEQENVELLREALKPKAIEPERETQTITADDVGKLEI